MEREGNWSDFGFHGWVSKKLCKNGYEPIVECGMRSADVELPEKGTGQPLVKAMIARLSLFSFFFNSGDSISSE